MIMQKTKSNFLIQIGANNLKNFLSSNTMSYNNNHRLKFVRVAVARSFVVCSSSHSGSVGSAVSRDGTALVGVIGASGRFVRLYTSEMTSGRQKYKARFVVSL